MTLDDQWRLFVRTFLAVCLICVEFIQFLPIPNSERDIDGCNADARTQPYDVRIHFVSILHPICSI